MSRESYGADIFSPIRGNASFNGVLSDEKESDYFDLWQEPYGAVGKKENSEVKENKHSIPFRLEDEASSTDKVPDLQTVVKTDSIVEKKNKKCSSETDRLSYVTTRSKNSHKGKTELGVFPGSQSIQDGIVSKSRKKNYVTVRPEVESNKEVSSSKSKQTKDSSSSLAISTDMNKKLPPRKIKQNMDSALSLAISADSNKLSSNKIKKSKNLTSLISTDSSKELLHSKIMQVKDSSTSLVEEEPEKSPTFKVYNNSIKYDHNDPGYSDEQVQTHKMLSKSSNIINRNHSKSKKLEKDSKLSSKKCIQVEKTYFTSDCKESNLRLPEKLNMNKENQGMLSENSNTEHTPTSSVSKPEQIQANIIEKLVKDVVSFEFDGIRQMLYLHQLQILKHIDQNVANSELQKTIDDLVEENRRLKNIIANQKT